MESLILWLFLKVGKPVNFFVSFFSFSFFISLVTCGLFLLCWGILTAFVMYIWFLIFFYRDGLFFSVLLLTSRSYKFFYFHASVDDVIGTLLSLYMHDSSQSLPTAEEVLICTPDTTTEEVSCWLKLLQKARNVVFQSQKMLAVEIRYSWPLS